MALARSGPWRATSTPVRACTQTERRLQICATGVFRLRPSDPPERCRQGRTPHRPVRSYYGKWCAMSGGGLVGCMVCWA